MYFAPARSVRRAVGLVIAGFLLLSGCAQIVTPPDPEAAWRARNERMSSIEAWQLQARIGVVTDDDGGTATMRWRQSADGYEIDLYDPFGRGLLKIFGTDTAATLETPEGETLYAGDAETLFQQRLGWRVPVVPLRRWLLGLATSDDQIELDREGRLKELVRDEWQVSFTAWEESQGYELPQRLTVQTQGLRIRLVVHSWRIP